MANDFFTKTGVPSTGAAGTSSTIRAEIALIEAAFDKMPTLTANGSKAVAINAGATALEAVAVTGTGSFVRASSPTLVTPVLGVATATSINKITFTQPATSATLTIADGKTLTASNTITFTATDGATLAIGAGGTLGTGAYATIANYAPLASPVFTGYVGIGNSSASDMDALNGAGRLVVGDGSAASAGATIYGSALNVLAFADALTAGGSAAGSIVYDHATDKLSLSTAGIPRAHIDETGLEVPALITATGGQIKFPATQVPSADANTLDDYEEGSTTPGATAGSGTFTTVACALKYTKIGNRCLFNTTVTITTNGTAATYVSVPLPFAAAEITACAGVETAVTGAALAAYANGSNLIIRKYDATYPGADSYVLSVSGVCRV